MTSDIIKLRYVLTLAEELNFSRAAQRLQISQPTLSQHISKLESELGVTLFDRSLSCIKLTDAGEIYVEGIRQVYEKLNETMDRISDIEGNEICRLSVGTSPSLAHYILPELISTLKQAYPKSVISIYEATTAELEDLLDKGVVDITLCVDEQENQTVCSETIYNERIVLAVPTASEYYSFINGIAKDNSVSFKEVAENVSFITLQEEQLMAKRLQALCDTCQTTANISVCVSELATAIKMLKQGLGVMLLPSTFKSYIDSDKSIAFFDLTELSESRSIAIHYRKSKYLSNLGKYFVECLKGLDF